MAVPDIKDHATPSKRGTYYGLEWTCKYCTYSTMVRYDDFSNLRKHLRVKHLVKYRGPFIINEEPDEIWSVAK